MAAAEVWITGIGLLSSVGEGVEAHFQALTAVHPRPSIDRDRFAPFALHPVVPYNLDAQIPRRGDQRQMQPWQHIGTYAAGLALADAGIAGKPEFLERTDLLVACGGSDRDVPVDSALLDAMAGRNDQDAFLNSRLLSDLRPTLFLGQLPNLLAGNISIVHKVTGSSRTFLGEEGAGMAAISTTASRIAAGQGDLFLVGGASGVERKDLILNLEIGSFLWSGDPPPVWARPERGGGMVLGTMGAFLVLESRAHAEARGATPYARIASVATDRSLRTPGAARAAAEKQIAGVADRLSGKPAAVISGATGVGEPTAEERGFLESLVQSGKAGPIRAAATILGSGLEADFPGLIGLSAIALQRGTFYAPFDDSGFERPALEPPDKVLVTSWGHWRGEALALVERVG